MDLPAARKINELGNEFLKKARSRRRNAKFHHGTATEILPRKRKERRERTTIWPALTGWGRIFFVAELSFSA
jgi:hypothetical protein